MQWFFKDEIKSHGWYTADLRRAAVAVPPRNAKRTRARLSGRALPINFFPARCLEEKVAAVFLLEKLDGEFGDGEFKLFESWLDRISSWADHDALVHDLIAPMVASKPARAKNGFPLGEIAGSLAPAGRLCGPDSRHTAKMFFPEITELSDLLLADEDDMVQKGLGWLLRETAKFDPKRTVPYLMKIRGRALRDWCCGQPAKHCRQS